VESFVTDANTWREHQDEVPTMEFYETDELGNQLDNWIGPSVSCLMAMCRPPGLPGWNSCTPPAFTRGSCAIGSGSRFRGDAARGAGTADGGKFANLRHQFFHAQGEYVTCWFRTADASVTRDQLRLDSGRFRRSSLVCEA
jgi:hypothetical protein